MDTLKIRSARHTAGSSKEKISKNKVEVRHKNQDENAMPQTATQESFITVNGAGMSFMKITDCGIPNAKIPKRYSFGRVKVAIDPTLLAQEDYYEQDTAENETQPMQPKPSTSKSVMIVKPLTRLNANQRNLPAPEKFAMQKTTETCKSRAKKRRHTVSALAVSDTVK